MTEQERWVPICFSEFVPLKLVLDTPLIFTTLQHHARERCRIKVLSFFRQHVGLTCQLVTETCLHAYTQYPWDIIKQAHSLGLMNGAVPTDCGGPGLGVLDECIIAEELAYACTGIMTALVSNGLAVRLPESMYFYFVLLVYMHKMHTYLAKCLLS